MDYYIDEDVIKKEYQGHGKYILYYRCGCKICERCWFRNDIGVCIYGGPFSGFEMDSDKE